MSQRIKLCWSESDIPTDLVHGIDVSGQVPMAHVKYGVSQKSDIYN